MTCFWADTVQCYDPACISAGPEIFASPSYYHGGVAVPVFYSDAALAASLAPTTAEITHVTVYTQPGGIDFNACEFCSWQSRETTCVYDALFAGAWGSGSNADSRVFPLALAAPYSMVLDADQSIVFDPTADPGWDGIADSIYAGGSYFRVFVFTISTDLGVAKFLVGDTACF